VSASIDDLPLRISRRIVVDERSGCWIWTGGRAGKGRPYMHWEGGMAYAYRVTYHLLVDRSLTVRGAGHTECLDHVAERCRYRPNCVNPDHLERVPWAENVRRFYRANPGHGLKGWATRRARAAGSDPEAAA
jgi:hypothetical protein